MTGDIAIYNEKLDQAHQLLAELDLDAWLLFVRETSMAGDPAMRLIVPWDLTWESALLVARDGTRIAIVGRYDMQPVESSGLFGHVHGYDAGIGERLREALGALDPQRVAINYSTSEVAADGLTHGMFLRLHELLAGTPYTARLVSAHDLVSRLRAQKTAGEQARLVAAVDVAQEIFTLAGQRIKIGVTEQEIAQIMQQETWARGMSTAWISSACPIVNTGPASPIGHATPTELRIEAGHLVHIDFGVVRDGYCSDQQRMWYVLQEGETEPPVEVKQAWEIVRTAIESAFAFIEPGLQGWQVDDVARRVFVDAGKGEYRHALGHGVGRAVHDGGPLLGPRWDRYGQTPYGTLEVGMVCTLECGLETPHGYLGLEEEIVIEKDGARWLSPPQTELWLVTSDEQTVTS